MGDSHKLHFYILLILTFISLALAYSIDNQFIFIGALIVSNLAQALLLLHKWSWAEARRSFWLNIKNSFVSIVILVLALNFFSASTGKFSINGINLLAAGGPAALLGTSLVLLASLMLLGVWPFHAWRVSSLNSSTPASAILHTGFASGGILILSRFLPLISAYPSLLFIIFLLGVVSCMISIFGSMVQHDIKGVLSRVSSAHMAIALALIGLGLASYGIAYFLLHSFYISYQFLATGAAAKSKLPRAKGPPVVKFIFNSLVALACCYCASAVLKITLSLGNPELFLLLILFIFVFSLVNETKLNLNEGLLAIALALILTLSLSFSLKFLAGFLSALHLDQAQKLTIWHQSILSLMVIVWALNLYISKIKNTSFYSAIYLYLVNSSLPKLKTITANRNNYKF